jgi:hypothetical protein
MRMSGERMLTRFCGGREEASGIPTLLVAPRTARAWARKALDADGDEDGDEEGVDRGIYEDGVGDSRGWYEDGAYTAAPTSPPSSGSVGADDRDRDGRDAQAVYYEALLGRFEALRQQLAQIPPRYAVERLSPDHGCYMSASTKDYKMWRWRLGHTEPKPAQLAGMDKGTVIRLLRMAGDRKGGFLGVESLVREGGVEARRRVSAWIWGLLARLPGRGELISEEVGVVRELGKRAVWVGVEMKGVDMGVLEEQMGEGGEDDGNEDEEIVNVEVDGEDELPNSEVGDEGFPEGGETLTRSQHHDTSEPRNPGPSLDRPIIGSISPEFLRSKSSQHLNPIGGGSVSDNPTIEPQEDEDAALATARARLLAQLGPHPEPQPLVADDIQTLLEGRQKVTSLPNTNAHEAREKLAALQKQLDKLISARKRQKDHPLRQELEEEVKLITHFLGLQRCEVKSMEDAESRRDKDAANAGNGAPGSEDGEWAGDAADKNLEGEDDGTMDGEQEAKEEQGEDRPSAIQAAKVLLDMIITIAGEAYGQRDLLEFREVWE